MGADGGEPSPANREPDPSGAEALLAEAREHLAAGRTAEVRRCCDAVLERHAGHPLALLYLGTAAYRDGDTEEGVDLVRRAAAAAPERAGLHASLGEMLMGLGRFAEAAESMRAAIERDPQRATLNAKLGVALQQSGDAAAAEAAYRAALQVMPQAPEIHYNLATALKRQHRFDEAIDSYARAVSLAPRDPELQIHCGIALVENGRFEEASRCFNDATLLRPRDPRAWDFLAYTRMKLEDGAGAVEAAQRLLQVAGASVATLSLLGSTLLCAGDATRALDATRRVLDLDPGNRNALADRAIALSALDRREEAATLVDLERFPLVTRLDVPDGFRDVAEFNAAIVAHIRSHPVLNLEKNSLSCHHGATSDELLVEPKGPVANLEAAIEAAGERFRRSLPDDPDHPYLGNLPDDLRLSAWTTILRTQGYQHGHIHPTAWISGVYYVSLPDVVASDTAGQSGWIEFGRAPYYYACADQGSIRAVQPEPGMLVLFPSHVYHRTIPFESGAERITIAFDFREPPAS